MRMAEKVRMAKPTTNVRIDPCNQSGETIMGRRLVMRDDPFEATCPGDGPCSATGELPRGAMAEPILPPTCPGRHNLVQPVLSPARVGAGAPDGRRLIAGQLRLAALLP